jgi:hypothetical protein
MPEAGADARAGELPDLGIVHMDGVGVPDIVAGPVDGAHVFDRPHAPALQRVALLVERLAEMRV